MEDIIDIAHSDEYCEWIWWYRVSDGLLEIYKPTEVRGHQDSKFLGAKEEVGWIKGRVFAHHGFRYLLIYVRRYGHRLSVELLIKIIDAVKKITKEPIDFLLNDEGEDLLESKKDRRKLIL